MTLREGVPPDLDPELHVAAVHLVKRTGATSLDFGYIPGRRPAWWAKATYRGAVIMVEKHAGPNEAMHALCEKLLTGGQCQLCGGLIALSDEGAIAFRKATLADGRPWNSEESEAAGLCRWRRDGARWESGCVLPPEGDDEVHTAEKLARALAALADPEHLREIMWRARRGYYHDFLSPLPHPAYQLVHDLRAAGHEDMAQRVMDGDFDASDAEAAAWKASPDGRRTVAELMGRGTDTKATGKASWRQQRDDPTMPG